MPFLSLSSFFSSSPPGVAFGGLSSDANTTIFAVVDSRRGYTNKDIARTCTIECMRRTHVVFVVAVARVDD